VRPIRTDFIKNYLGPALHESGLGAVALFCYDHNCDRPDYPITVLGDAQARRFVSGVAWHLYGGKPRALSRVASKHPGIKTYLTEQYVGAAGRFSADLAWHTRNVLVGTIRNGAQAVLEWNLASDPNGGPHTPEGSDDSLGALTIGGSSIVRNLSYYIIAHLSRFVRPGSIRISSTAIASLPNVAFVTPEGDAVCSYSTAMKMFNLSLFNSVGVRLPLSWREEQWARTFGRSAQFQLQCPNRIHEHVDAASAVSHLIFRHPISSVTVRHTRTAGRRRSKQSSIGYHHNSLTWMAGYKPETVSRPVWSTNQRSFLNGLPESRATSQSAISVGAKGPRFVDGTPPIAWRLSA